MIASGFFNSVNGDRKYDAKRFAEYFNSFIGNGVFPNPSTNLQVIANDDMTVTVKEGKAWINGYVLVNDDDYILNIDIADGVLDRIDRVVLRYDVVDREIRVEVKKGIFASGPVAPILQRDADAYELGIADVYIGKGVISINQGNITDLRQSSEYCGIVHGTVDQVDVTTLYNQYTQGFELKKAEFEQEFLTWFATLQDVLDENTATNLLNMINTTDANLSNLQTEVTTHKADDATLKHKANQIGFSSTEMAATNVSEAILETFMLGNSTKQDLVDKLLLVDDSLPINHNSSWQEVLNSVNQISTGKKWASGTTTTSSVTASYSYWIDNSFSSSDGVAYIQVSGLEFVPSIIYVFSGNMMTVFINSNSAVKLLQIGGGGTSARLYDYPQTNVTISNSFKLPVNVNYNTAATWLAVE